MKKRYWLRGGITGVIFLFWCFAVSSFFSGNVHPSIFEKIFFFPSFVIIRFDLLPSSIIGVLFGNILSYFILGAIIGGLYGKIKNKNQIK